MHFQKLKTKNHLPHLLKIPRIRHESHLLQPIRLNTNTIKLLTNHPRNLIHPTTAKRELPQHGREMNGVDKIAGPIYKIAESHAVAARGFYIAGGYEIAVQGNPTTDKLGQMYGADISRCMIGRSDEIDILHQLKRIAKRKSQQFDFIKGIFLWGAF